MNTSAHPWTLAVRFTFRLALATSLSGVAVTTWHLYWKLASLVCKPLSPVLPQQQMTSQCRACQGEADNHQSIKANSKEKTLCQEASWLIRTLTSSLNEELGMSTLGSPQPFRAQVKRLSERKLGGVLITEIKTFGNFKMPFRPARWLWDTIAFCLQSVEGTLNFVLFNLVGANDLPAR